MAWRKVKAQGVREQAAKRQRQTAQEAQCPKCHRKGALKVYVTTEGVLAKACRWEDCGYWRAVKVLGLQCQQTLKKPL